MKKMLLAFFVVLLVAAVGCCCVGCTLFGDPVSIESIEKTGTEGLVDTYTITMTDGTTSTFTVTNGTNGADVEADKTENCISDDYFRFNLLEDDTYEVSARYQDMPPSTLIPNSYNGKAVTAIAEQGFFGRFSMDSIIIPVSIKSIGRYVFDDCVFLEDIRYMGTKEEWDDVIKEPGWYKDSAATIVHCSDGDVTIVKD